MQLFLRYKLILQNSVHSLTSLQNRIDLVLRDLLYIQNSQRLLRILLILKELRFFLISRDRPGNIRTIRLILKMPELSQEILITHSLVLTVLVNKPLNLLRIIHNRLWQFHSVIQNPRKLLLRHRLRLLLISLQQVHRDVIQVLLRIQFHKIREPLLLHVLLGQN